MPNDRVIPRNYLGKPVVDFRRILVATDFSTGARTALNYALELAQRFQSKVYVAHVIPSQVFQSVAPESSGETLAKAKEYAAREMQELINSVCMGEVAHEEILGEGQVWPVLQEIIKSRQIDLVAMGTHGRASDERLLLGAVAEEIFRMADIPVLSVGPEVEVKPSQKVELCRLLYATNFKPHSERAGDFAYACERDHQARLTVLHVVEDAPNAPQEGHEIVREFLLKRMRKGIPAPCVGKCEPEFVLRFGDPVQEILRTAQQNHSDMIVVGLRAAKRLAGHLPSAIAYRLVCQSPCPVLTLRH